MKKVCLLLGLLLGSTSVLAAPKALDGMGNGAMSQMFLLVAFVGVFYFLILRPQSKRAKEHQNLVAALQKGEEVITNGGLLGRIEAITDSFLMLNLADGVSVWVQKQAIASSVPKGTLKSL
ncbi:MAG: preprotein translocase subunit YajC [Gammaproteobacteria bacterium]|nr:preprotein translocase subunit YajC [Gammaproteobacteria bacterium]MBP9729350.1 preprotein translocase subunit YajC [Gammaproteobacteria bacterium]